MGIFASGTTALPCRASKSGRFIHFIDDIYLGRFISSSNLPAVSILIPGCPCSAQARFWWARQSIWTPVFSIFTIIHSFSKLDVRFPWLSCVIAMPIFLTLCLCCPNPFSAYLLKTVHFSIRWFSCCVWWLLSAGFQLKAKGFQWWCFVCASCWLKCVFCCFPTAGSNTISPNHDICCFFAISLSSVCPIHRFCAPTAQIATLALIRNGCFTPQSFDLDYASSASSLENAFCSVSCGDLEAIPQVCPLLISDPLSINLFPQLFPTSLPWACLIPLRRPSQSGLFLARDAAPLLLSQL